MIEKIAIMGAGKLGSALRLVLAERPVEVASWDVDESKMPEAMSLEEALAGAQAVLMCLPSWHMREAAKMIAPHIPAGVGVWSLAKGLEERTNLLTVEILEEELGEGVLVGALSGPMLADELVAGKIGAGVAGCFKVGMGEELREAFAGTNLQVEVSEDRPGVAWGGVLKNVYAMGLGMVEGLELGDDMRGWFVAKAAGEMGEIMAELGGKAETALTVAGIGDLIATGFSKHSRNYTVGRELAIAGTCETVSEGHQSLPQLLERLDGGIERWPLLQVVKTVAVDCEPAREVFDTLIR